MRSQPFFPKKIKIAIAAIFLLFIGLAIFSANQGLKQETVTFKVIDKQALQIIGDNTTKFRYLVIGDNETFIVETAFFQGKYNNSDIYFRLMKDSTYTCQVAGIRK